jgi:hypothetical protein
MFLRFARAIGAIDEERQIELQDEAWEALQDIGISQFQHIAADNPIEHFQNLLSALFSCGRVYVADPTCGGKPLTAPESWGWRKKQVPVEQRDISTADIISDTTQQPDGEPSIESQTKEIWISCGVKIGWVDFPYVYFIPEVVFAELQSLANRNSAPLPFTVHTLEKRLADAGTIMRDEKRGRIRIRITAEGTRQYVLKAFIRDIRWLTDFGPDKEEREDHWDMLES